MTAFAAEALVMPEEAVAAGVTRAGDAVAGACAAGAGAAGAVRAGGDGFGADPFCPATSPAQVMAKMAARTGTLFTRKW